MLLLLVAITSEAYLFVLVLTIFIFFKDASVTKFFKILKSKFRSNF